MLKLSRSDGLIACWSISWEAALILYMPLETLPWKQRHWHSGPGCVWSRYHRAWSSLLRSDSLMALSSRHVQTKLIPEPWIASPSLALMSLPFLCALCCGAGLGRSRAHHDHGIGWIISCSLKIPVANLWFVFLGVMWRKSYIDKVIRLRLEQLLLVDMVTIITREEFQSSFKRCRSEPAK